MQLLPVPARQVEPLRPIWEHFARKIAEAGEQTADEVIADITELRLIVLLAWDGAAARAMAGVEIERDGKGRKVCHVRWCTGYEKDTWFDLIDQIHEWARDHLGCTRMRATARFGWKKALKAKGYRLSHIVMERDLGT